MLGGEGREEVGEEEECVGGKGEQGVRRRRRKGEGSVEMSLGRVKEERMKSE